VMGDPARKRSPLEGFRFPTGMREVPFLAQVNLRIVSQRSWGRLASVLEFPLPLTPNTVAGDLDRHALWLGPDEWLVVGPAGSEATLETRCRDVLDGAGSVVDVSASRTIIELRAPEARVILETGCAIDLHPRAFHAGCCAQTLVARTAVIVHQVTDEPQYRLFVRSSFAMYLAIWLQDASE
jgi:sarcosine oxidase subunit gamma